MESELLKGLNASQRLAVTTVEGPLLLLAGPGSGKTRVVTHRIAYMVQQGVDPKFILALTFTNKAAGEMQVRVNRLIGDDSVWMGTFHGFCVRLLRRYASLMGLPSNFSIYDTDDALAALRTAVEEAKFSLTHVTLGALANRISYFKNRLVTPEMLVADGLTSDEHQVAQVYPFYQQQLLKLGAVDFDDLLMHTATLLRSSHDIRSELDERYRYIMVDEYQDTNLAQYVIMRQLSIDFPNLAVTGDPDQSIYGWRGANLKNVSYLERDYPQTKIIRLEDNYRSTPQILSVADCLIQNNEFRKAKKLVPSRPDGSAVRIVVYPTGRREADAVVSQIVNSVSNGERSLRDFAILYRTNVQSRLVEQALARQQIPYQLIGGFRFYLRKEIKDLVSYLLILHNPQDDVAFERAVNTPARGIGKQTVARLREIAASQRVTMIDACRFAIATKKLSKKTEAGMRRFLEIQDRLRDQTDGSLVELVEAVIELTDYRSYLRRSRSESDEQDSEMLSNLDELIAQAAELDAQSFDRPPLELFLEIVALQSDADRLKSADTVTLMTLHAAKGLEFPVVFIIAVEENILPHSRSKDDPMAVEEERRLLFVGITRAKDELHLSYARRRSLRESETPGIPSSFLMELPRGEMIWCDLSEPDPLPIDHDPGQFDDYSQLSGRWDEDAFSQEVIEPDDEHHPDHDAGLDSTVEFDEACQLSPDEMPAKVLRRLRGSLKTASQMENLAIQAKQSDGAFVVGRIVSHPKYGSGRIVAASGLGPKRTITVDFFSNGDQHDFRLSHAQLTIESQ